MPKKKTWIITGRSESGDEYGPKKYDHKPTWQDKALFIIHCTPEALPENLDEDEVGPGAFGSYVHLEVSEV